MGITSPKDEYFKISAEILCLVTTPITYDVYVQIHETKYTKIFLRGEVLDPSRVFNYMVKGSEALYIRRVDRRDYIVNTENIIKNMSFGNVNSQQASLATTELTKQTLYEIFEDKIFDIKTFANTSFIVDRYIEALNKNASALTNFISQSRNSIYLCRHSIATAIFAILLAKQDDKATDSDMKAIAIGSLLQDVGMAHLPIDYNEYEHPLKDADWVEIKKHPQIGADLTKVIAGFPNDTKTAIEQHHEQWNGSGYPFGLSGTDISYSARVLHIALTFSALTTRRMGRPLYSAEQALVVMATERGKYDPQLILTFIKMLKPKKAAA